MSDAVFFPGRPTEMGSNILQSRTWIMSAVFSERISRIFLNVLVRENLVCFNERHNHHNKTNEFSLGNVHKGRLTILGHFGHTYLPMSDVFYTMPIPLVPFLLRYLSTYPKIGRPLWMFPNGSLDISFPWDLEKLVVIWIWIFNPWA